MKVVWNRIPLKQVRDQVMWYQTHCGLEFVASFSANIYNTVQQIAQMPTMGVMVKQESHRTIRKLVAHPGCIILYAYNTTTIRILRLLFTRMKNE